MPDSAIITAETKVLTADQVRQLDVLLAELCEGDGYGTLEIIIEKGRPAFVRVGRSLKME